MHIRCEQCGVDMEVPPRTEGKKLRCPECGLEFICRLPQAIVLDEGGIAPPDTAEVVLADESEFVLAEEVSLPAGDETGEEAPDSALDQMAAAAGQAGEIPLGLTTRKSDYIVKPSPRQWHVMIGGAAAVALTYQELKDRAAAGEITPRDKVWYAPKDVTISVSDLPGLFPAHDAKRAEAEKARRPVIPAGPPDPEAAALIRALDVLAVEGEGKPDPKDVPMPGEEAPSDQEDSSEQSDSPDTPAP